ncbi:MFS transporter, partial [Francisella tularensis subsp. holarctica]|nr:MFS transporter [Francisella tularensis subsp. holarctica]
AILIIYRNQRLYFTDANATLLFGSYVTFLSFTTAVGGILADRFIGYRRCVLIGVISIISGHIMMAL